MTALTFDVASFRAQFTAFSNATTYPNVTLQAYWDMASCYISTDDYGYLSGACRQLAVNQMTAHLLYINDMIVAGNTIGLETAATVDKVSVTLTPPPVKTQFQWWLSLSPYGQQLLALLKVKAAGGFYIGGTPEGGAFRKVGSLY